MASDTDRDPIDELAESFVERYRQGERPSLSEYVRKCPEQAARIQKLFPTLAMMEELGSASDDELARATGTAIEERGLEQVGDYRILREVGRGGMGVVYEAEQESLGRRVALKVLPLHGLMDQNHLKRFQREARAAARLHHTNIVPVFDVGENEGIHFYAMQFIHGQGLDEVMSELIAMRQRSRDAPRDESAARIGNPSREEPCDADREDNETKSASSSSVTLPWQSGLSSTSTTDQHYFRSVASVGAQVADALSYAHEQGVLHRDVKPSNLMLDTEGMVWVTDFGLAKIDAKEDLTHTGDMVGTLRYMAPERFDGWSDPRSDIYGLGLTLYELLTLQSAYNESDRARLIKRVTNEDLPRPRRTDRNIPVDLETIILKSIAREPADRYPSANDLAEDLRRFLNKQPIEARRTSVAERTRMWCRRNPLVAGLTITIATLLVAVTVGATLSTIWLRDERNQALTNLARAETAERTTAASAARERNTRLHAERSLYSARLAQARAGRWSDQMGRRFDGLEALTEAARLARQLDLGKDAILQLRNEAIACMALVDLRVDKSWPLDDGPPISQVVAYDADVQRYARLEPAGEFVISRMEDNSEVARLPGFGDTTTGGLFMRFSPEGRYFAAKKALNDSEIQVVVWDLETSQEVFRASAGGDTFFGNLDFSPDGRQFTFFTAAGSIGLHDLVAGETRDPIPCPGPLIWVRFAPDGRQLAAVEHVPENSKGHVFIIDLNRQLITRTLELERRIDLATWGPDGTTLATPAFDGCVYIWDVVTGQRRQMSGKHGAPARLADYSSTGDLLVSMASEPGNRAWDPRTGRQLMETERPLREFSRDGRWLSSANVSGIAAACRLEVAAPRECRRLVGHQQNSEVVGVSFSADGRLLVSATKFGSVRIWDVAQACELANIAGGPVGTGPRRRVAIFDRSGEYLVTVGNDVDVWPVNAEVTEREQIVTIGPPDVVASSRLDWKRMTPFVEGGKTLALPSMRGEILFVNLGDTSHPITIKTGRGGRCVTVSPCGKWFASGDRNRPTIEIYDSTTGSVEKEFAAPKGSLVQFSPDGKWLVGSLRSGQIVFWQVGSWQESHRVTLDGRGFSQMAFSLDCRLMAVTDSFHVTLLDPASGREIARLSSPDRELVGQAVADSASGIAFSPDDSTLAVGSDDGPIQLWDLRLIREQLAEMGLDWDHPPIPPASPYGDNRAVAWSPDRDTGPTAGLQTAEDEPNAAETFGRPSGRVGRPDHSAGAGLPLRVEVIGADSLAQLDELARLNHALKDDPNDFPALLQRVRTWWALRRYEEMMLDANRMIELRPDEHHGLVWRAFPLMMLNRYDEAIQDYQDALAIHPDNAWPMRHLAWMYLTGPEFVRDINQARELAEKAVQLKPTSLFLATLGAVCYRQGEFETARKHLEKAASPAVDDDSQTVRLLFLAMTQQRLGQPAEARQRYDEALRRLNTPAILSYFRRKEIEALRAEAEESVMSHE